MKGFCSCLLTVFLGAGLASVPSYAQSVNVTTWHNDNGRTGQNTNEITLTTSINKNNFGKLCSSISVAFSPRALNTRQEYPSSGGG